jgi:hypothetical protein
MRPLRFLLPIASFAGLAAVLALAPSCFKPEYPPTGFYCHADDDPACPDGQTCVGGRCVGGPGGSNFDMAGGLVPKSGSYTGAKLDPMLNDANACTDNPLEPNDTIQAAVTGLNAQLNLVVDQPSPKLQMLAICPTGDNPKAEGHDIDYYEIEATQSSSAVVEIFYDVKYGDLDVGIFRPDGSIVASDGSAVSNGCVAATLPAGKYYVGVGGAQHKDSNRYDLRIRFYSTPKTCTAMAGGDMAN